MRLVEESLWIILFTILQTLTPLLPMPIRAQSPELSPRALDSLLQAYAFRALRRPRTGIPYDGPVPGNLTGVKVSALRLRSGSLRTRGFDGYKEFSIPAGVAEQPYVDRLVLVYKNLGNWSSLYYPLPGYTYLAPILGLLAYDGSDLSAKNVPELDIRASENPITIKFRDLKLAPDGLLPVCVYFDLHGALEFNTVLDGNVCSTTKQGHFSIVVEFTAPSPPPSGGGGGGGSNGGQGGKKHDYIEVWAIAGSVIGGFVWLVLLGIIIVLVKRWRCRKRIRRMEKAAEGSVPLQTRSVGNSRVPMATGLRTRPVLENEYVP